MADKPKAGIPAEWLLAGGTIFALSTGLLLSEFGRFRQSELLTKEVAAARADADAALKSVIVPGVLEEAEKSVYIVYSKSGWGSAFVIDRDRGILGTAGHVVEALDLTDRKDPVFAANRFSKKPLPVYAKRLHAGYHTLSDIAEEVQPLDPTSSVYNPRVVSIFDASADAGVLFVDPIDPETGENILGPNLPIASRETLLALKPGDPIAAVSYPANMVSNTEARASAAARSDRGTISALVSPIDLAAASDDPASLTLIVHRMAITGGSSGSPVFNRDMEVIGITSYGVATGDTAAQRADLIHDLLANLEEEVSVAKTYEPDWRARLEKFTPARDGMPMALYRRLTDKKRDPNEPDDRIGDLELEEDLPFESRIVELKFPKSAVDAFVQEAKDLRTTAPVGVAGSAPARMSSGGVSASARPVFVINMEGRYLDGALKLDPDTEYAIFAFDYATSTPVGACPVALYTRLRGENVLSPAINLPVSEVRIPKAAAARDLELIFARPVFDRNNAFFECNDANEKFIVGVVTWKDEKGAPPAAAPSGAPPATSAAPAPAPTSTAALHNSDNGPSIKANVNLAAVRGGRFAKIRNFADCNLAFGDRKACIAPVKVEYRE